MNYYDPKKAEYQGMAGENMVARILCGFDRNRFIVLNNILLQKPEVYPGDVPTVQIDHMVVSIFGIFCIETKNIAGSIYGMENSDYWKVYVGKEMHYMRNPLMQNHGHSKTLQKLLELNAPYLGMQNTSYPIIPIIAFSERAKLKVMVQGADVVYYPQVPDAILRNCVEFCLTNDQMERVAAFIWSRNTYSPQNMQMHIAAVNRHLYAQQQQYPQYPQYPPYPPYSDNTWTRPQ